MKIRNLAFMALVLPLFLFSCNQTGSYSGMNDDIDTISYALGVSIGNNIKEGGLDTLNADALAAAISEIYEDKETSFTVEEANTILSEYFASLQTRKNDENMQEGEEFLEQNLTEEDVQETETGLQYIVLEEGEGPQPEPTDKVRVHYTGTLIDGTVFDSSRERGEPAEFFLNRVIPGWTEGLQLMKVGGHYKFFVPSQLAYGENPRPGGVIEPNMVLIFDVELLEILESDELPEGQPGE